MENKTKNHLHVTCAIIERDGLVLAAKRSATMSMPLKWEFPGGKIRPGETKEACLVREINEELGVIVSILTPLPSNTHHYPDITVSLYPFICRIESGDIILSEHSEVSWVDPGKLHCFDWAEADLPIVNDYVVSERKR